MKLKAISWTVLFLLLSGVCRAQAGWFELNSGTTLSINEICFPNSMTGYAVGDLNLILKSTNSGQNWTNLNSGIFTIFLGVDFISDVSGYIVGYDGRILKTTNGGNNWINQTYNTTSDLWRVRFINSDTGFAAGDFLILKTTNGGNNWNPVVESFNYWFRNIQFVNSLTGYAAGFYGEILKTTNCGDNWMLIRDTPEESENINSLFFLNSDTGYIGGYNFNYLLLKRTLDGGNNWDSVDVGVISTSNSIKFFDFNTGFLTANSGRVLRTTNAGVSWQSSSLSTGGLYSIDFVNSLTGYICGSNGKIFKTTNGGVITGINNEAENVSFYLSQNYPNPFNPVTKIRFDITRNARRRTPEVKLVVYDALGREIQTLVNQKLAPGSYETEFSGSNFASGIYFFKLETEDFSEVKRMMLLK